MFPAGESAIGGGWFAGSVCLNGGRGRATHRVAPTIVQGGRFRQSSPGLALAVGGGVKAGAGAADATGAAVDVVDAQVVASERMAVTTVGKRGFVVIGARGDVGDADVIPLGAGVEVEGVAAGVALAAVMD